MDFSVIELDPRTLKEDEMPFYVPVEKTADTVPKADISVCLFLLIVLSASYHSKMDTQK